MKLLHITVSDETFKELKKYPNMSHVIREALTMYNEHISTDTLKNVRMAFAKQTEEMNDLTEKIEKLINVISEMNYR